MTQYIDRSNFDKQDELDRGILTSLVVESAAGILDTLLPLGLISGGSQNVATQLLIGDDGGILHVKLALAGKSWGKKMDAKRIFVGAPAGSKLVIDHVDLSGLEFPPGEKTSLWIPSSEFDWKINKGNNRDQGTYTSEELVEFGITGWCIRVHVEVNKNSTTATLKWVGIPRSATELNSLPGDAKRPGYPSVALSDGEANMTGTPDIGEQAASLVGIPFYPILINQAAPASAITFPADADIINAMCEFWRSGNTIRNMHIEDWTTATRGPGEPTSDRGTPAWAWPPAETASGGFSADEDSDEPSEGRKAVVTFK